MKCEKLRSERIPSEKLSMDSINSSLDNKAIRLRKRNLEVFEKSHCLVTQSAVISRKRASISVMSQSTATVPSTPSVKITGTTIVEPFKFATDARMTRSAIKAPHTPVASIPTAELMQRFMTDARSHGAPKNSARRLTVGHSPKLRTKGRGLAHAKSKPMSDAERIDVEMEEIKKNPFKARVLDRRIFHSTGELGVPKVAIRPVTEPKEFNLKLEKRSTLRSNDVAKTPSESTPVFKARPLPAFVVDPSKIAKLPTPACKLNFKATVGVSPKFHRSKRSTVVPPRRRSLLPRQKLEAQQQLQLQEEEKLRHKQLKITEPQEFRFITANRGAMHRKQLQQQVEEEAKRLAQLREHKANPMPNFDEKHTFQPDLQSHKAPLTEPQPFQLLSAARHEEALQEHKVVVAQVEQQQNPSKAFKARRVPSTLYKPDVNFYDPSANAREALVPLPITLESDIRAIKRQAFDAHMADKMSQLAIMQEELDQERQEKQHQRIRELRRTSIAEGGMAFKAAPILKAGDKELEGHYKQQQNPVDENMHTIASNTTTTSRLKRKPSWTNNTGNNNNTNTMENNYESKHHGSPTKRAVLKPTNTVDITDSSIATSTVTKTDLTAAITMKRGSSSSSSKRGASGKINATPAVEEEAQLQLKQALHSM